MKKLSRYNIFLVEPIYFLVEQIKAKITNITVKHQNEFKLFDELYKTVTENTIDIKDSSHDDNVAHFKNGILVNVKPRDKSIALYDDRGIAYNAKTIISDGKIYSLKKPKDIRKIPIPNFSNDSETVFSMDYILRMCASNLRKDGNNELSILVLSKAIQLMLHSNISWQEKDYLRIVLWLYEDGYLIEGDKYEEFIRSQKQIQIEHIAIQKFQELIKRSDLIAFNSYSSTCCKECAIYSGRVYSATGKNKKYPKLPKSLYDCGCYHPGCSCGVSRYYFEGDYIYYKGQQVNPEISTFRKYVDDRTSEELQRYNEGLDIIKRNDYNRYFESRKEYFYLKWLLPNLMPKSMSAYTKIKNQRTEKFLLIVSAAKEKGYEIKL